MFSTRFTRRRGHDTLIPRPFFMYEMMILMRDLMKENPSYALHGYMFLA